MAGDELSFGNHKRAVVYKGAANLREIVQAEMSGQYIERIPNVQEERGDTLVMGKGSRTCSVTRR